MKHELHVVLSPEEAADERKLKQVLAQQLNAEENEISAFKIIKRSVDARSRNIKINLKLEVYLGEEEAERPPLKTAYPDVSSGQKIIVVGAGPAGLFAALRLVELGFKPVILERGKDVRSRRRDLAAINKQHLVNPHSNYCFGEGGAGTYSDGKLYTRSTKRGDVNQVLDIFVAHGASETIQVEAHPHIGTNKLPHIIVNIRQSLLQAGADIHFNTNVVDLIVKNGSIKGVVAQTSGGVNSASNEFLADAVILATGHSARNIFELLHRRSILIEAKPFAMGVRAEHPQALIDAIQYHCATAEEVEKRRLYLPPSSYSLVTQVNGRGVYSFCMCPGGIIAPCATSPGEVVTNGWSPSKRNNPFANSGVVVAIELEDLNKYKAYGALAGLRFQQELEQLACMAGGNTQTAPAQRMTDFVNGKLSSLLPETSYQPGIRSAPLHELLPPSISKRLQHAFKVFGQKMKGYLSHEAVLHAVESRTSSPVRIPRDPLSLEHPQIKGLYPCGEGAGYAGGIVSAAIDGQKCAEACLSKKKR